VSLRVALCQKRMISLISSSIPVLVVISNILGGVLLVALMVKNSWGDKVVRWVGQNVLALGLLLSLATVSGSLFYSEVVGFEPCVLCWWQRVTLFPLLVLFAVAMYKKDRGVFKYAIPLSVVTGVVAIYNAYIQWGGSPLIPCDVSGSCAKLYVYAYGYITLPTMSLSVVALVLLLAWANKVYQK